MKVLDLEFYVMLSSSMTILRSKCYETCATGNALQVALSMSQEEYVNKCITLDLGGTNTSSLNACGVQPEKDLEAQGLVPMTNAELDAMLEYAMNAQAKGYPGHHVISGFDRTSLEGSEYYSALDMPLFNHLPRDDTENEEKNNVPTSQVADKHIADGTSREEAQKIVTSALQHKISTLVAIEQHMVELDTAIEDFGLDSLIMWGVRNWIFRDFRADLDPSEISDAASIASLASMILDRSKFRAHEEKVYDNRNSGNGEKPPTATKLPRQPLPHLQDTLEVYLETARPFCSDEELERTISAVAKFKEPNGLGQQLQDRLAQREADPKIENWLGDLYTHRRYLRLRTPLVACQSYFGTHPIGQVPHEQAERATIISLATFQFKQDLESGKLVGQHSSLSGQAVDPETYQWLFNACREPHVGEDQIRKYPSTDYVVVLRYGHAFKVTLKEYSKTISFEGLKGMYESILASTPKEMLWVSALTADERDRWAKVQ